MYFHVCLLLHVHVLLSVNLLLFRNAIVEKDYERYIHPVTAAELFFCTRLHMHYTLDYSCMVFRNIFDSTHTYLATSVKFSSFVVGTNYHQLLCDKVGTHVPYM